MTSPDAKQAENIVKPKYIGSLAAQLSECRAATSFAQMIARAAKLEELLKRENCVSSKSDHVLREARKFITGLKTQGFLRHKPRPKLQFTGMFEGNRRRH